MIAVDLVVRPDHGKRARDHVRARQQLEHPLPRRVEAALSVNDGHGAARYLSA